MLTTIPRVTQQDAAAELAKRVAAIAKLRTAVTTVRPHLTKLGPGEQRLIRICEWSVNADSPLTDEQSVWLDDIVSRVSTKQVLN